MFETQGRLRYSIHPEVGYKLIVEVDPAISHYYRSLVPKYVYLKPQMYPAHISVVRKETPPKIEFWGKYEGEFVTFSYDNYIQNGKVYYWLNAFSKRLEEIREELGLPVDSPYTRPPDGLAKTFHITIGNLK